VPSLELWDRTEDGLNLATGNRVDYWDPAVGGGDSMALVGGVAGMPRGVLPSAR
jgi:hypothetical protein